MVRASQLRRKVPVQGDGMRVHQRLNLELFLLCVMAVAAPASAVAQVTYPPHGPTIAPVMNTNSTSPEMPAPKGGAQQSNWNMDLAGPTNCKADRRTSRSSSVRRGVSSRTSGITRPGHPMNPTHR